MLESSECQAAKDAFVLGESGRIQGAGQKRVMPAIDPEWETVNANQGVVYGGRVWFCWSGSPEVLI